MKDPRLLPFGSDGLNAGTPPAVAAACFVTPTRSFFTRSHAPVPQIDPAAWRLRVSGLVSRRLELSLDDLRSTFQLHELTATIVCAGLRRAEFLALGPLPGELPWGPEPASTGRWRGVALAAVLQAAIPTPEACHIGFTGLDQVERHGRRFGFGGSVCLEKALSAEVLLAFELNGRPLPPEHGFPLRVVVPGWVGARSVKWLGEIEVRSEPSTNYFQAQAYRVQRVPNPLDSRDVSTGEPLSEITLNSVILSPEPRARLAGGLTRVAGWAIGHHARPLARVEVSPDDGGSWIPAALVPSAERWAWRFWEAILDLPAGEHTLVVRAWDDSGAGQPPHIEETWNVKGYANNAWHRVRVEVGV